MRPRERLAGLGHLPWQCSSSSTTIRGETSAISLRPAATVDRPGRPCHLQPTGRRWARQNDITNIRPISCFVTVRRYTRRPETKRPVSELYGRSGSPAAPRVIITSSPASAGLFLGAGTDTILSLKRIFAARVRHLPDERGDGLCTTRHRVSRQGTRVRRTRRTDVRFLYQGTIPRSCEEVAPNGRTRRQSVRQGVCPPRRNRASLDHTVRRADQS